MTRRDFFQSLFPLRRGNRDNRAAESSEDRPRGQDETQKLFLAAMRLGIDPATMTPQELETVLAGKHPKLATTDDKGASGSDLAGPPDTPRRPQQRGGPDGDERQRIFVS